MMERMLPGDTAALRKARGAFFTPVPVAEFVADWAVQSPDDSVLEPSCGEAVFLHAVGRRADHRGRIVGVELHKDSARHAQQTLRSDGIHASIHSGDFLGRTATGDFDAVIGNPPYVRYQEFSGEARAQARAAALKGGVNLTGLASSWAAFTVHSALHLRPGGRLGLVLPAELLSVNYAASVRQFLMDHFQNVGLVLFRDRVFPGVLEEVVLLLADGFDPSGTSGTDHCEIFQVQDADDLKRFATGKRWTPPTKSSKWTPSMLHPAALNAYSLATNSQWFGSLEDWGSTTLGMVTGNNKFFALSSERVAELGLGDMDLIPLSPPGSKHLRNLALTTDRLHELASTGEATWLFRPGKSPSRMAKRYIAMGEATGVNMAYKCRVRTPWWQVPLVRPADLLLTYMNADTPRLCTNKAGVHHLNSVHGVNLDPNLRRIGLNSLPLASLNSVSLLGAETVGRAYGGGMLKIEPREADHWPMPSAEALRRHAPVLRGVRAKVSRLVARGDLLDAVDVVDAALLVDAFGLPQAAVAEVRDARAYLAARRAARGKDSANG